MNLHASGNDYLMRSRTSTALQAAPGNYLARTGMDNATHASQGDYLIRAGLQNNLSDISGDYFLRCSVVTSLSSDQGDYALRTKTVLSDDLVMIASILLQENTREVLQENENWLMLDQTVVTETFSLHAWESDYNLRG